MSRRTKIIATIGPASESEAQVKGLIEAGMDVARLALGHDPIEQNLQRYETVRRAARAAGRPIGILVDLPGPKVRAGSFGNEGALLLERKEIKIVPGDGSSDAEVIHVDYDTLLADIPVGDHLSMGDGQVVLRVEERDGDGLRASVIHGGVLKGRPGMHIRSDRLRTKTPTAEDLRMLDAFLEVGVDMVAISFVRSAHDVRKVGTEPHPRGPLVVAKVETLAAIENLDGIVEASGGVMVARGDLGAECKIEELPHLQKEIIRRCIALGRPVITATQMLESMVDSPIPTRAEASDVANAVFDGSSALMLSGETAVGRDPTSSVRTMARIAERADQRFDYEGWATGLTRLAMTSDPDDGKAITDVMTSAAWRATLETETRAILCLTRTGFTVRSIARFRPQIPILGFSDDERTVHQLTMSWGAVPIHFERRAGWESDMRDALDVARRRGDVRSGDLVAVLVGSDEQQLELTDTLRLARVP